MADTQTDPDPQIVALVTAQAALRAQFTAQAVAIAEQSAQGFTGWYDTAAITAWAAGLATTVEGLQRVIAQTTDAYLARILSLMTGGRVAPLGRVDMTNLRAGGVTHAGAYGRAADAYRWQQAEFDRFTRALATGQDAPAPFTLADPVTAAVERVKAVADMDAQLADRAQTTAVYTAQAKKGVITGYRRVIHPEESRGGSCGLCVAASDRLYSAHEPKPIHGRCHCTTLPVLDRADPGSALNAADLRRLYKEAGGTSREGLKATRYQVDEHGELGPLLNKHGTPVRTETRAVRDTNRARPAKSDAERRADLQKVLTSQSGALPKARELAAEDPKQWGGYLSALEKRLADLQHQLAA